MFDRTDKGMWWDDGINAVWGCKPVSAGCAHCWSAQMTHNFQKYPELTEQINGIIRFTGKTRLTPIEKIIKRFSRKKPTAFAIWNDLFHPNVPSDYIDNIFEVMAACPQHTFQILTKRPELIEEKLYGVTEHNPCRSLGGGDYLPNVWLGTTVENNNHHDRIDEILQIPAAIHFGSLEPLLGNILLLDDYTRIGFDWTIIGPETGPGRRECKLEWIQSIVEQCAMAKVPCFVKALPLKNGKVISKNMDEWPPWAQVRQYPEV